MLQRGTARQSHGIIKGRMKLEPVLFKGRRGGCLIAVSVCQTLFGRMSAAGETIAVTVRCKVLSNGEEIVQLPSTTTALQLKEYYAQKHGLNVGDMQVVSSKGAKILKDPEVLLASVPDSQKVVVTLVLTRVH